MTDARHPEIWPVAGLKIFLKKLKKVLAFFGKVCYYIQALRRASKYPGVAKFGIALEWGSRGRWFESSHSDQKSPEIVRFQDFLSF